MTRSREIVHTGRLGHVVRFDDGYGANAFFVETADREYRRGAFAGLAEAIGYLREVDAGTADPPL